MRDEVFAELGITVLPGARETARRGRARYQRALVTGSSRVEVAQVLPHIGADRARSTSIVAAEDVPRSKPAPDGYLAAMRSARARAARVPGRRGLATPASRPGARPAASSSRVRAGNFGGWDQTRGAPGDRHARRADAVAGRAARSGLWFRRRDEAARRRHDLRGRSARRPAERGAQRADRGQDPLHRRARRVGHPRDRDHELRVAEVDPAARRRRRGRARRAAAGRRADERARAEPARARHRARRRA